MTSSNFKTALSDRPVDSATTDILRNNTYAEALARFIRSADTPLTIGIQGGWGTGKTSLLNLLKTQIENHCLVVKVNAWEYSLFATESSADVAMGLLQGMVRSLQQALRESAGIDEDLKNKISGKDSPLTAATKSIGKAVLGLGYLGAKVALSTMAHIHVPESVEEPEEKAQASIADKIGKLRAEINSAVSQVVHHTRYQRFVFLIDDLDRVDPKVATEILDVLKNVFDVDNCVFVLAIDYEVVIKGLSARFGLRGEMNEREYRQYFDKIIQVPFSMPLASYKNNYSSFTSALLKAVSAGFLKDGATLTQAQWDDIAKVAYHASGGVPRTVKRILNTVSLLSLIKPDGDESSDIFQAAWAADQVILLFKLACLQVCFPEIYQKLQNAPEFWHWSFASARESWNLDLPNNSASGRGGDADEWKNVLQELCRTNPWLKSHEDAVLGIFESMRTTLGESPEQRRNNLAVMNNLLGLLAVTSVRTVEAPEGAAGVRNDDITRYSREWAKILISKGIFQDFDVSDRWAMRYKGARCLEVDLAEGKNEFFYTGGLWIIVKTKKVSGGRLFLSFERQRVKGKVRLLKDFVSSNQYLLDEEAEIYYSICNEIPNFNLSVPAMEVAQRFMEFYATLRQQMEEYGLLD